MSELRELQQQKESLTAKYNRARCAWIIAHTGFGALAFGGVGYLEFAPDILKQWTEYQRTSELANQYLMPAAITTLVLTGIFIVKTKVHKMALDEVRDQIDLYKEDNTAISNSNAGAALEPAQDYKSNDNPYAPPRYPN